MLGFYFFTIICSLLFSLKKELGFLIFLIGGFYFLSFLPSTMMDYETYKQAYDNAYIANEYPWFKTRTSLTAEPFYLWYTSFFGNILPFQFSVFLGFNFIFCVFLSFKALKSQLKTENILFFWLFLLPVIFPTIFYFSPRSSISFFLILLGFMFLVKDRLILAIIALLFGISTHSQFLLATGLMLVTYISIKGNKTNKLKIIYIYAILLFIFLKLISSLLGNLVGVLSFLPSADVINAKLEYFNNGRTGFRITGVLSIIIYPFMAYKLMKKVINTPNVIFFKLNKKYEVSFMYLLFALIIYGAVINSAFINIPHLAGRLSRFSDYLGMGLILPLFLRYNLKNKVVYFVLVALCIIAPVLYKTLYHGVDWSI